MSEPLLLDVKRLAVNDGPGIRTAFFVKGCPLRRNTIRDTRTGIHVYYLDAYGARPEGEKVIHRIEIVSNCFERVENPFDFRNAGEVAIRGNIVENLVE